MKFDLVIGNPPYSIVDTLGNTNFRKEAKGENLAKSFLKLSLQLAKKHIAMIVPQGRKTLSPGMKDELKDWGSVKIQKIDFELFPNVLINPVVVHLDKTQKNFTFDDETKLSLSVPKRNLGELFKAPGSLYRNQYEDKLKDSGKYRIWVSTNKLKYTDDEELILTFGDKTRGHWRVIVNKNAGGDVRKRYLGQGTIGKIEIAHPEDFLNANVMALIVNSKKQAILLKQYLQSPKVNERLCNVSRTPCNSKQHFKYIELPPFLR